MVGSRQALINMNSITPEIVLSMLRVGGDDFNVS